MNNFLHFITHSSIFIAICATSLSYFYTHITFTEINYYRLSTIFFATLLSYIGVQLIPISKNLIHNYRSLWIKKNKIILIALMISSIIGITSSVKHLSDFDILNFSHLFIIVLFYEKIFLDEKELRKIPYIKPFLISYIWACACSAPQVFLNKNDPNLFILIESYFFILALTIPFDIRDIESDNLDGLKTLATKFTVSSVKRLSFFFFLLSSILQFLYLQVSLKNLTLTTIILVIYMLILSRVWPNQKEGYFLLGLDGIILLKLLYLLL